MKARISQLYKTEAEWSKLPNFVPICGEFIVFAPDEQHPYARIKIGDGNTLLKKLPFFGDPESIAKHANQVVDAGRITDNKK